MTWNGIQSYSTTPGSNTLVNGINIAPGGPSSSVGPVLRQMMADIAAALAAGTIGVPAGSIHWFPVATAPSGYQALDGSAISRAANPNTFAMIGTTYGAGDGSTTFNVPDWRGRTPVGYDAGNASGRMTLATAQGINASGIGNTGGEQAHTQAAGEVGSHTHTASSSSTSTVSDTGHAHGYTEPQNGYGGGSGGNPAPGSAGATTAPATTGITVSTSTTTTVNASAAPSAANVVQPGIVQLPCIKIG